MEKVIKKSQSDLLNLKSQMLDDCRSANVTALVRESDINYIPWRILQAHFLTEKNQGYKFHSVV